MINIYRKIDPPICYGYAYEAVNSELWAILRYIRSAKLNEENRVKETLMTAINNANALCR